MLFDGTVAANVAYGELQDAAARGSSNSAVRGANAMEFIERLPQGLDTPIGARAGACPAASASAWRSRAPCSRTRRS